MNLTDPICMSEIKVFTIDLKEIYDHATICFWDNCIINKDGYSENLLKACTSPEKMELALAEGFAAVLLPNLWDIDEYCSDYAKRYNCRAENVDFILSITHEGKLWAVFNGNQIHW